MSDEPTDDQQDARADLAERAQQVRDQDADELTALEDLPPTDDVVAVVTVDSLERGSKQELLGPGDSLTITEDGPNKVTVQTAPREDTDE